MKMKQKLVNELNDYYLYVGMGINIFPVIKQNASTNC
jgi:hypothetical protein